MFMAFTYPLDAAVLLTHDGADVPFDCNNCPDVPAAKKLVAQDPVL